MASFVGKKYKLEKSENFDEYMKELGKCPEDEKSPHCSENFTRHKGERESESPKTRHRNQPAGIFCSVCVCAISPYACVLVGDENQ